ncbi:TonB-dependent receptor [Runella sp. MFBS21]|uniref:TonB-dependent receptor n=1 Tax=Runella sp. MFBS21 TaxID=3034018 RepID=UPI0023F6DFE6|nr:TonB-dependent receptor [Runella sp. MFBS21]MDF7818415.1 TonB-dependent receptor [Runella sp. MFBS21]
MDKFYKKTNFCWTLMKISFTQLLIAILCMSMSYARDAVGQEMLDQKVTLRLSNEDLKTTLGTIERTTKVRFVYNPKEIQSNQKVSLNAKNESLKEVLTQVFDPLKIGYEVKGKQILLFKKTVSSLEILQPTTTPTTVLSTQNIDQNVTGKVTDEKGEPLVGVTVQVRGTTRGATTDPQGVFRISVPDAKSVLVFSYIGYAKQEIVIGNRTALNVSLEVDDKSLEEVVVVGYGVQKKVNMTGAVSTIDSKVIQNRPSSNLANALQGTTPGLIITRVTGQPGSESLNLQIRGATTANGDVPPLVILDGVTVPSSTLLNMNPNDVESMSVLKDAAAAAIYGAQAAGGVILVTTKKGSAGKVKFEYLGQYGTDWAINVPKRMSLLEEAELVNLGQRNAGAGPEYNDFDLEQIRNNVPYVINPADTNTYLFYNQQPLTDQLLRKYTSMRTHNFTARGGTEKVNFMISAGYYEKQGVFKVGPDNNKRFNLRFNLGTQLTKHLSLDTRLAYTLEKTRSASTTINEGGILYQIYRLRTRTPFFTPEGRYSGAGSAATAYAELESGGYNNLDKNYFDGTFTLKAADIVKGLTLRAVVGTQIRPENRNAFLRTVPLWGRTSILRYINQVNSYRVTRDLTKNLNLQFLADYNFKIGDKHSFSVLGGYQWEDSRFESVYTQANNLVSNDLPTLSLGDDATKSNSETIRTYAFQSVFGRFNYNYADKYLFEATVRQDESSKLAPGLRKQVFPSASVGWNVHREAWFGNSLGFISELKLRGSWGRLGGALGSTLGFYDYLNQLSRSSNLVLGDVRTSYIGQTFIPSAALSWETIETTNGGIDLGFFQNHLQANFDYYVKYNRNMLTPQQLPATIGISTPRKNNGELKSWGWELDVRYRDRIGKDFNYNISFNLSDNQNKLINFSGRRVINAGFNNLIEGYPINTLWGYQTAGYFTSADEVKAWAFQDNRTGAGDVKYIDRNGDGRLTVGKGNVDDYGDLVYLGTTQPRYLFGATLGFDWKGFDFLAFFQGVGQRSFRPNPESIAPRLVTWKQPLAIHSDYWTPENPNALYPRPFTGATHNYLASDKWTLDAKYMRLKNLQVGYTIPSKLTQKVKVDRARVFFSGQDLFTISGLGAFQGYYDPETRNGVENDYPFFATASVGLNVSF